MRFLISQMRGGELGGINPAPVRVNTVTAVAVAVAGPDEWSSVGVLDVVFLNKLAERATAEDTALTLTAAMERLTVWVPSLRLVAGPKVKVPRDPSILSGPAEMFPW